jgi:DNA-binding response OmpR family regulator
MENTTNRLLLIDDDIELCELLTDYLSSEGFDVEPVYNGEWGIGRALSGDHALVVLDVMLPGISGFEVLRHIRDRSRIPVLMLTARGDDVDRIVGLETGADDYLPKPFNPRDLIERIRTIKRCAEMAAEKTETKALSVRIFVGDVELDVVTRTILRAGSFIELTTVEFNLLEELLLKAGQLVRCEELAIKALGRSLSPYDRSIDVHISSLRKKLGPEMNGLERIKAVRGIGYLYAQPFKQMDKGNA